MAEKALIKRCCLIVLFCMTVLSGLAQACEITLGVDLYQKEKYAEAYRILEPLAKDGDSTAQYLIGDMYLFGKYVAKNVDSAMLWYRLAAQQGHAKGQMELGRLLLTNDLQNDLSIKEGIEWYEKAALNGDVDAQRTLGGFYAAGIFVKHDLNKAKKWYSEAASNNDEMSIKFLEDLRKLR